MSKRLFENTNLSLFSNAMFNNLPVQTSRGDLVEQYLSKIKITLDRGLEDYTRLYVLRFDLRYPNTYESSDTNDISKFIASLKSQIKSDLIRKGKSGKCSLRYIWAKEKKASLNHHYHVSILLNKDVYFTYGDISSLSGNLSAMINQAWASALGVCEFVISGCIHFPENCNYWIDKNDINYSTQYKDCFNRLSYLAKVDTKIYTGNLKNFCCSRG